MAREASHPREKHRAAPRKPPATKTRLPMAVILQHVGEMLNKALDRASCPSLEPLLVHGSVAIRSSDRHGSANP